MAGEEFGCLPVEDDFFDGADLPKRLGPVVAAFAVEFPGFALQQADVTGKVGRGRAGGELHAFSGRLGKPTISRIIEEREDDVDLVVNPQRQSTENLTDPGLGDPLELFWGPRDCLLA
jgi:hypothetical protein